MRIIADAGGVLFLLCVTFYTFNMLITLNGYRKFATGRQQKLDDMKNTKENNKEESYKIDKSESADFSQINLLEGEAKVGTSPKKVLNEDTKEGSMF